MQEVLVVIRAKFDKAKEEVDSDLAIFAADLVGILEKNADSHPNWKETLQDLLVLARSYAMTSSAEFWLQCEGIVQELDNRRQRTSSRYAEAASCPNAFHSHKVYQIAGSTKKVGWPRMKYFSASSIYSPAFCRKTNSSRHRKRVQKF